MRMRVAAAHHGAAILEDLHVAVGFARAQLAVLPGPGVDDVAEFARLHVGDGEIGFGREAHHTADARLALRHQQPFLIEAVRRRIGAEGGEVVIENEGGCVTRIARAASALIAGAKVAAWVVFGLRRSRGLFYLPLPGPLVRSVGPPLVWLAGATIALVRG